MKVLILGSEGNLGGQLKKIFSADSGYEVICTDQKELDLTERFAVEEKITNLRPNIIINATAYNAVDKCEESDEEFRRALEINGRAVGFLAEASLSVGAILVHYSTDYVFSGEKKEGYQEDDAPAPINNYGHSKLAGEKGLLDKESAGLRYYLVRLSKLFGPRGQNIGAKENFFDLMMKISKDKPELDVVDDEESLFTYSLDLALATKELLENKYPFGIYHLSGGGESATWYQAAKILFAILKKDVKINPVSADKFPRPAKRPAHSVLLNTKFRPIRPWPAALSEYLKSKI